MEAASRSRALCDVILRKVKSAAWQKAAMHGPRVKEHDARLNISPELKTDRRLFAVKAGFLLMNEQNAFQL